MKEIVEILRGKMPEYLAELGIPTKSKFRCLSPLHEDKHPSMGYYEKGKCVKCFSCGYSADIFKLYALNEGFGDVTKENFPQIINELRGKYGLVQPSQNVEHLHPYLKKRGFSEETVSHFGLQVVEHSGKELLIIPYPNEDYQITREIENKKFKKPAGRKEPLFLTAKDATFFFIVESALCAISIYQCGYNAIALNGVGHEELRVFLSNCHKNDTGFALCMDNDAPGQQAAERIKTVFHELRVKYTEFNVAGKEKDINDLLQENPSELKKNLSEAYQQFFQNFNPDDANEYLKRCFFAELSTFQTPIKTGFAKIDQSINSFSGFVIFGGAPSVGKTTFMLQLADRVAEQGTPVLYFSYEQSKSHLHSKNLGRFSYETDSSHAIAAGEIIDGNYDESLIKIMRNYIKRDLPISIITEQLTAEEIEEYVDSYIQKNNKTPMIIVDYLQIVPVKDNKIRERSAHEHNIKVLSQLCKKKKLTGILVSALNRSSYLTPLNFESFKETGLIEFSSDIVCGLQYSIVRSELFMNDGKMQEKNRIIEKEKSKKVRQVDFVCLKQRYGQASFVDTMQYSPRYDYFSECAMDIVKIISNKKIKNI